ncbi:MAG: group 1 truncated hemoglobin [Bdellovibrionales bacterium]|nr:group 1 truncated hemoglobin [Bdellovibrionales bacterium]
MDIYDKLSDKTVILEINEHFYDQVYEHPWLSKYFQSVSKEHIVQQQTDFMVGALGGPNMFCGRNPTHAHPQMFITDELFDLRKSLLKKSFKALKISEPLEQAWLRIDEAFRGSIVKSSREECKGRWKSDPIIDFVDDRD